MNKFIRYALIVAACFSFAATALAQATGGSTGKKHQSTMTHQRTVAHHTTMHRARKRHTVHKMSHHTTHHTMPKHPMTKHGGGGM